MRNILKFDTLYRNKKTGKLELADRKNSNAMIRTTKGQENHYLFTRNHDLLKDNMTYDELLFYHRKIANPRMKTITIPIHERNHNGFSVRVGSKIEKAMVFTHHNN